MSSKNKTNYKVCILAAGMGSRVGYYSDIVNKAVLPINNKAVISYVIEKFPEDVEIIIAVGHMKESVVDCLTLAYPERNLTFVEVDNFSGPGSGPGYSLQVCKKHLQCPFVFATADTIVIEDIPTVDGNWIGVAPVDETEPYCTVKMMNDYVVQLDDKIKTNNTHAFIGIAGIKDHEEFFEALEENTTLNKNELQMVDGFQGLLGRQLKPVNFTWFDTGTQHLYETANAHFSGGEQPYDFGKTNEFLYFMNGRVIKYFANNKAAESRYKRAQISLKGISPKLEGIQGGFYSYQMVPGQTMYNTLNDKVTNDFLAWANENLWQDVSLDTAGKKEFKEACHAFYYQKTKDRLDKFYSKTSIKTDPDYVNQVKLPQIKDLLKKVDWDYLADGLPSNFHGDLQCDNILVTKGETTGYYSFTLLDWRQDFGGLTEVGDRYYDLAKFYGGLLISYPLIKEAMFDASIGDNQVNYHYFVKDDLTNSRKVYEKFINKNGYDLAKIKLITSLIFLNMSPLHNEPFDILLYGLGRKLLNECVN